MIGNRNLFSSALVLLAVITVLHAVAHASQQEPPAAAPAPAAPTPAAPARKPEPAWKSEVVATMVYSKRDEQRETLQERYEYAINPQGHITGKDLMSIVQPIDRETFVKMLADSKTPGDPDEHYKNYLQESTDQAIATLALNRILDEEAMKRRIDPKIHPDRVRYVVRSILKENAKGSGKDLQQLEPELYALLKTRAGDNPVKFNIDWNYKDGSVEYVYANKELQRAFHLPATPLSFRKLPDSFDDFVKQIELKLQAKYLSVLRKAVWHALVTQRVPDVRAQLVKTEEGELTRYYETLKEHTFRVMDRSANVFEMKATPVNGSDAATVERFRKRYKETMDAREKELRQEIFGKPVAGGSVDELDKKRAEMMEMRKSVPLEIYSRLSEEFAGEIDVVLEERTLVHKGGTEIPADNSTESRQLRAALNPALSDRFVIPTFEVAEKDGPVRVIFLKETVEGEPTYLPRDDKRVESALTEKARSKIEGLTFKRVARELFAENDLRVAATDAESDAVWPLAIRYDADKLSAALFPVRVFPDSTEIFDVSLENFARVFELRNEKKPNR